MKTLNLSLRAVALAAFIIIAMLAALARPVQAHHSFAAEFDADLPGELTGVVTQVRFSNPHVRYRVDVTMPDGSVEDWELQSSSVTSLRSQNWTADTVKVGDTIKVSGQLGRGGSKKLFVRGMTLADGTGFGTASTQPARTVDRNAINADEYTDYSYGSKNTTYPMDITGAWRQGYKFRVTVDDLEPKPTPFTAEGRRIFENTDKYDDPALRCISLGLPRIFGNPYNMSIYDAGDHYLFLYVEHNSPRRVWMDGRTPPADTAPTSNGYSVGHWENANTLVIETTHLLPGWLDGSGLPMSGEGTKTVERIVFADNKLSADRTMVITDPYYTQPLTRVRGWARDNVVDVSEQASCDPASYYTDLLETGQIEEYLNP
jgi:hypothetical protein